MWKPIFSSSSDFAVKLSIFPFIVMFTISHKSVDSQLILNSSPALSSLPFSILHLFILLLLLAFIVIGMMYHGDTPFLPERFLDCCAGLHVAMGFLGWYFPPVMFGCIGYQIADSQGLNESVSGHGAEPIEWTVGDCLEYIIGAALCIIAHRVKPLHTLNPHVLLARIKNFWWSRFTLNENDPEPTYCHAVFHLFLILCCASYFAVGLRMVPSEIVNDSAVITKFSTYTRCCSNIHIALGPSAWYCPLLFMVYFLYQYTSPTHWNQEGTSLEGIMLEYIIGATMAAISHRVTPIRSLRPREGFERFKNLVWDRNGEMREEREKGWMEETEGGSSRHTSRNASRNASRN